MDWEVQNLSEIQTFFKIWVKFGFFDHFWTSSAMLQIKDRNLKCTYFIFIFFALFFQKIKKFKKKVIMGVYLKFSWFRWVFPPFFKNLLHLSQWIINIQWPQYILRPCATYTVFGKIKFWALKWHKLDLSSIISNKVMVI